MKKKQPHVNILITVLSFIAGGGLVYAGLKLFLNPDQVKLLFSKPFDIHVYTLLFLIPTFVIGGIQTYVILKMVYNKQISLYDILTLPFVLGLWGFLIPFHGAFVYNTVYLRSKYKIAIVNTTSISLVSLSISICLAGLSGLVYSLYTFQNIYFLLLSTLFLIHPIFGLLIQNFNILRNSRHAQVKRIGVNVETIFKDYLSTLTPKNMLIFTAFNLIDSFVFSLWSLWVARLFNFDLSFVQLLLLQFFMKVTILFKFTPGNLGVNQFASSGIILLVGGNISDGFTLSLYQTAIGVIASVLVGSVFSIVNMKHFFGKIDEGQQ